MVKKSRGFLPMFVAACLTTSVLLIAGCGGGGSSTGGGAAGSVPSGSGTTGNTGGSGAPQTSAPVSTAPNVVPVTVAQGVANVANVPTVSVTICVPGTSTCQTVDNVQVDTESFGLRLTSNAIQGVIGNLPQETVAGLPRAECAQFASGYTWGTVRTADVHIGGEMAAAVPIQVTGDLPSGTAPSGCANGTDDSTSSQLGANGILGIGVAATDCGPTCATTANGSDYYICPLSLICVASTVTTAQEVTNPVTRFATDNNGVILALPGVSATGNSAVTGTLTFGIGTESNNALLAASRLSTSGSGDVNATFGGNSATAFFDSGSNADFFADSALPACAGVASHFYCPSGPTPVPVNVGNYSTSAAASANALALSMTVANGTALLASGNHAFDDLAGGAFGPATIVDLGLPFFYGRTVYYGFDQTSSGGQSPYVAF
jgi:hypothetical protein